MNISTKEVAPSAWPMFIALGNFLKASQSRQQRMGARPASSTQPGNSSSLRSLIPIQMEPCGHSQMDMLLQKSKSALATSIEPETSPFHPSLFGAPASMRKGHG